MTLAVRSAFAPAAALSLALAVACGGGESGGASPSVTVLAGDEDAALATATIALTDGQGGRTELTVELAVTAAERGRGLMFRQELPEDHGMLFVWERDTQTGFWMKDASIPLSIAFIAADGLILDLQDMQPFSKELHYPPEPYRFALEVNRGWFERHRFGMGDRVEIPDSVGDVSSGE